MGSYLSHFGLSEQLIYPQRDLISTYLQKYFVQDLSPEESRIHLVVRRCLQTLSLIVAAGGKYPFVAINLKLGGNSIPYAIALTWGNVVSYATLLAWALLNMIDVYLEPMGREEKALRQKRMNFSNTAILASAIGIGAVSEVPFAYLAYAYNDGNLFMPAIMFLSDSWVPIYSVDLNIRRFVQGRRLADFEKNLVKTRDKIVALIEDNQDFLIQVKDRRMDYAQAFDRIKELQDSTQQSNKCLELLTQRKIEHRQEPSLSLQIAHKAITLGGLTLTLSHMIFIWYMSYKGAELMWDNTAADATAATAVVGANVYLEGLNIPRTAVRIFDMIKGVLTCNYRSTLSDQFAPKLSFASKAVSLATAALAYGPSIQISKDYFDGPFSYYMQVAVSCAVILLVSTALLDITDQLVEGYVARRGSDEAKLIMKLNDKMKRFCQVLKESPLLEYARFLKALPEELFKQLVEDTEVTVDKLGDYIFEHLEENDEVTAPLMLNGAAEMV